MIRHAGCEPFTRCGAPAKARIVERPKTVCEGCEEWRRRLDLELRHELARPKRADRPIDQRVEVPPEHPVDPRQEAEGDRPRDEAEGEEFQHVRGISAAWLQWPALLDGEHPRESRLILDP